MNSEILSIELSNTFFFEPVPDPLLPLLQRLRTYDELIPFHLFFQPSPVNIKIVHKYNIGRIE